MTHHRQLRWGNRSRIVVWTLSQNQEDSLCVQRDPVNGKFLPHFASGSGMKSNHVMKIHIVFIKHSNCPWERKPWLMFEYFYNAPKITLHSHNAIHFLKCAVRWISYVNPDLKTISTWGKRKTKHNKKCGKTVMELTSLPQKWTKQHLVHIAAGRLAAKRWVWLWDSGRPKDRCAHM